MRRDDLFERAEAFAALEERFAAARDHGHGALVLVGGEAGIGKSSLVRAFCAGSDARVLWGACDPLDTPRPLGPLVDIAADAGGALAAVAGEGAAPGDIVSALGDELRRSRPSVVVLEDLHWADEATLDVLRVLARRIGSLPALVLGTYRDDELDRTHPLRVAIGELPREAIERVALSRLSPEAVEALAAPAGLDAAALHRRTGGNPFFVTEVLAAGPGSELPDTVRDAVLARAARLDPAARSLVDAVAVVPLRAEIWLLEAVAGEPLDALDACLASGILRAERDAVTFRHEIARLAVEEALAPHRRIDLHRRTLAALTEARAPDLARVAHHAEGAGDVEAVLRYAPEAAERAAHLGAHREAAAQLHRALRHVGDLSPERRAELLERRSYECYLTDLIPEAIDARRRALEERRALGDRRAEGDAHRWLSRLAWFDGDRATADRHARLAIELLEPLGHGRELAMAYSNMAQLRMLDRDQAGATSWGSRAISLAEELDEAEILVHALNNVGAAQMREDVRGRDHLERSLRLALDADMQEHVARAYTNLGAVSVERREYANADRYLEEGVAYCRDRDLESWRLYMTGWIAQSALDQGRWDAAAESADAVLMHPGAAVPTRITPLTVVGRLRARRGDPDPWTPLDEARDLAQPTGELQRIGRVAIARAEARWLGGEAELIAGETDDAIAMALRQNDRWIAGELALWRRRAGIDDGVDPDAVAEPFRSELSGDASAAVARWEAVGCPYEAALAAAHDAEDQDAQRAGLDALHRLGARPAARCVARWLRERGLRDLPGGPREATRSNPAGLTPRELEVLKLLAEGLRNSEIAARLFLSDRTVAHHVSAILRKLGVETRTQAGAEAARLGIV